MRPGFAGCSFWPSEETCPPRRRLRCKRSGLSSMRPMYGISDAIKLAVFTLQYTCALIGALIAVQLVIIAGDIRIAPSDQTPTALEHHETPVHAAGPQRRATSKHIGYPDPA